MRIDTGMIDTGRHVNRAGPRPVVHLELHTGDQAAASAFYVRVLGWRPELIKVRSGSYLALELGGGLCGEVVACGTHRPRWLSAVEVDRVDERTERARQLSARQRGAQVLLEPRDGPAGWRSVVSTAQGGEIACWPPKR